MKRLSIFLLMIVVAGSASAAVPHVFNYQGYVSDLDGTPLDGNFNLVFRIYDVSSGADPALWTETHTLVNVFEGVFSVLLGSLVDLPPAVLEEDALWVGVTVGTDMEIAPRLQVTSTPWAYRAAIADSAVVSGGDGGGVGTVTQVGSGAGLTGGPITTSGTLSVANEGITTDMLVKNAVTGEKVLNSTLTGIDILNDSLEADDIASGGVASDEILDNSVRAADVFDEPGVAAVRNASAFSLNSTDVNVTTKQIFHPASGYVVAIGTANLQIYHNSGTESRVRMSISTTAATHDSDSIVTHVRPPAAGGGLSVPSLSTTDVFPVSGSGIATFYLVGDRLSGGVCDIYNANLILMYFPTAYGTISKNEDPSEVSGD